MTQMPLANHHRAVASIFESLRQESLVGWQTVLARCWNDCGLQAIAERITASQECRLRRRAHWLNIELFEPRPTLSKLVDIRRLDVGAVEADVFPAQIIGHNVHNVRARR